MGSRGDNGVGDNGVVGDTGVGGRRRHCGDTGVAETLGSRLAIRQA